MRPRWSVLFALLLSSQIAAAADGMFRGDPQHHGVASGDGPHGHLQVLWRTATEGPVRSSPTVAGDALFIGSADGSLYALDRRSGRVSWRFMTGGPVYGSPAVHGDLVYVTSFDGQVHAVNRTTGKERWHAGTGVEHVSRWGFDTMGSSPTIDGAALYAGGADGRVRALDCMTGRQLWLSGDLGGVVRSTPAVAGDRVIVASNSGNVFALDRRSGATLWKFATEGAGLDSEQFGYDRRSITASPAVAGDRVIIGGRDGFLYGISLDDGKELWRFDHHVFWVIASAAIANGAALVGNSDGHYFQSFDLVTGTLQWTFKTPSRVFSSAAIAGQTAYFGDEAGSLFAVDAKSGREAWRFWIGSAVSSSPAVADGVVYVGADDGAVYAIAGSGADREPLQRAVYWQDDRPLRFHDGARLRDECQLAGYAVLDAAKLVTFLQERITDRKPSVVIVAIDRLPAELGPEPKDSLLRKYLEAGGRVVWLGAPPYILVIDPQTGKPAGIDFERSKTFAGVSFDRMSIDELPVHPAAAGRKLALDPWWLGSGSLASNEGVDEIFAADDLGRAVAWSKTIAGAGVFVMVDADERTHIPPAHVLRLAESF